MSRVSPIHVLARADGQWQVERECDLTALSVHDAAVQAIEVACNLAKRERRGLAIHRLPRPRARGVDVVVRAMLVRASSGARARRERSPARRRPESPPDGVSAPASAL